MSLLFDPLVKVSPQVTNPSISTPTVAVDSYQVITQARNQTQWYYVSTVQAATPGFTYQYKSQTERIQALQGRISLNQCR